VANVRWQINVSGEVLITHFQINQNELRAGMELIDNVAG
jgi:hypothetical protein